jgi:putative tricarboxylic transport membrane protein
MAPVNPGGGWDQTARLVQQLLAVERILPVPVEVINRGGASGTIGLSELIARDDPHTIMVMGRAMLSAILTNQSAVSLRDTTPIALLLEEYEVIAVPANSRYQTFAELLADFKREPQRISWGGGSAGGADHILIALIAQAAGVDPKLINYVAYAGGGEGAVSVMGGNVTAGVSGYGEWKQYADTGRLRFLAISSEERPASDGPPTIQESGLDVVTSNWRAIVAPRGTDPATRQWLTEAVQHMRASSGWQTALRSNYWTDRFLTGAELERFIEREERADAQILASIGLISASDSPADYAAIGAWVFPILVGIGLLFSSAAVLYERAAYRPALHKTDWRTVFAACSLLVAYVLLLNPTGYLFATTAFLVAVTRLFSNAFTIRNFVFSAITAAAVYALFNFVLRIGLPSGLIG